MSDVTRKPATDQEWEIAFKEDDLRREIQALREEIQELRREVRCGR